MPVEISHLISYPIKSCGGIKHSAVQVDAWGLAHDRKWMIVDHDQLFISQRKHPEMALISPKLIDGQLHLSAPGMADCHVKMNQNSISKVTVWKDQLNAEVASEATNQWLSTYLGTSCTLVQYGNASKRAIDPDFAQPGDQVKFADGYPILVTHEASLQAFNHLQAHPIPMDRFRPNIVVKSNQNAWSEYQWRALRNSQVTIELPKPCARCVMTGVDQIQGKSEGSAVLKRLKNEFAHQDKATFGMNGIARIQGSQAVTLEVGMKLEFTI
ncbi:MAG: MOSC domain-containing protein [Marinicella sp.]